MRRSPLAPCLALVGLFAACTSPGGDAKPTPTPTPTPNRDAVDEAPPADAAAIPLTYRFTVGETWREEVEVILHSSRAGEAPSETPTMLERRRERYEVLADAGQGPVIAVILEHLTLEPRGAPAVDSDDPPPKGADPLILERLAMLRFPIRYRVAPTGEVLETYDERLLRGDITRRWEELRESVDLPPAGEADRTRWERALDADFATSKEWGARPRLPAAPQALGATWVETVQTSTLFDASATWSIRHTLHDATEDAVTIVRDGTAKFDESAAFARYLRAAEVGLRGEHVIDRRRGVLLRSETTIDGLLEAAPQEEHGFAGGTLRMRRVLKRRRLDP